MLRRASGQAVCAGNRDWRAISKVEAGAAIFLPTLALLAADTRLPKAPIKRTQISPQTAGRRVGNTHLQVPRMFKAVDR
jgi:hypothetical protein